MSTVKSSTVKSLTSRTSENFLQQFPFVSVTRQGVMYLVVSLILLLTAINYSNHNILLVALFLISLFAVSLVSAVRYIKGVELSLGEVRSIFKDQHTILPINANVKNSADAVTVEIKVFFERRDSVIHTYAIPPQATSTQSITFEPPMRGRYNIMGLETSSTFPFGLFRVRRRYAVQQTFWVYPKPAEKSQLTVSCATNKSGTEVGESIALRQYRLGDPVRRIHKKSLAMGQSILVKDVEAQAPSSQWLQWDRSHELEMERHLQVLTRQVLDVHQEGKAYGLSLPKTTIDPAIGETQKHKCLRALAEY